MTYKLTKPKPINIIYLGKVVLMIFLTKRDIIFKVLMTKGCSAIRLKIKDFKLLRL